MITLLRHLACRRNICRTVSGLDRGRNICGQPKIPSLRKVEVRFLQFQGVSLSVQDAVKECQGYVCGEAFSPWSGTRHHQWLDVSVPLSFLDFVLLSRRLNAYKHKKDRDLGVPALYVLVCFIYCCAAFSMPRCSAAAAEV